MWISSASSEVNDWELENHGVPNILVKDIDFGGKPPGASEVQRVSEALNERGIHRPIKDGLEDDGKEHLEPDDEKEQPEESKNDEDEDATSAEEREMPGVFRPARGKGWWGAPPKGPEQGFCRRGRIAIARTLEGARSESP